MVLYIGDKPVGLMKVVKDTKYIDKTKFGMSIDDLFGEVDENGVYAPPASKVHINLAGVKSVPVSGFDGAFRGINSLETFVADDIEYVAQNGFAVAFQTLRKVSLIRFGKLEEISTRMAFANAFQSMSSSTKVEFPSLKRISGEEAFYYAFASGIKLVPDETFPVLEEITGAKAFNSGFDFKTDKTMTFSKLKKLVNTNTTTPTFSSYTSGQKWFFPKLTEISGLLFRNYVSEIHFAADNQVAIEASENYATKWGATNATIYFDL